MDDHDPSPLDREDVAGAVAPPRRTPEPRESLPLLDGSARRGSSRWARQVARALERGRGGLSTVAAIGLAVGLGCLDYTAGPEMALSLVYALPVVAAAWLTGFRSAAVVAIASGLVWLAVEVAHGDPAPGTVHAFNLARRVALFLGAAYLLATVRSRLDEEARSARTDFLTGLANARAFHEDAASELARAARYRRPFTIVYADVDDFKAINDSRGHLAGDAALRSLATSMKRSLRGLDLVARLGGDEFALLLPETDLEAARAALEKLRSAVRKDSAAEGPGLTVTMGALVCLDPPGDVRTALARADSLLLEGKRLGKDTVRYAVHRSPA